MSMRVQEARAEGRTKGGPDVPSPITRRPEPAEVEALLRQWEPLARRLAGRWGNAAEREDLEQVARIALWQAARRFDRARGCSFIGFALPTIQGALLRHWRDRVGTVRVPGHWWELRSRLQRQADAVAQELGRAPTIPELAGSLGLAEEEIARALGANDLRPRTGRLAFTLLDPEDGRRTGVSRLAEERTRMIEEPKRAFRLREEWMAVLFVGIVLLAAIAGGILLLVGL